VHRVQECASRGHKVQLVHKVQLDISALRMQLEGIIVQESASRGHKSAITGHEVQLKCN
jgi:hypothetical protein